MSNERSSADPQNRQFPHDCVAVVSAGSRNAVTNVTGSRAPAASAGPVTRPYRRDGRAGRRVRWTHQQLMGLVFIPRVDYRPISD